MALRFTNSRDGNKRATITVRARVGLDDLVNAVCWELTRGDGVEDVEEIPQLTKGYVERTMRDVLTRVGHESYGYWSDDVDRDFADELELEIKARIRTLFPDLR